MKKIKLLIILFISIFTITTVDAQNSVDYKLTITNDYKFKEEIKYTLSDYEQIQNGYNYFADIVSDDVYVDIMYKTKYKKTKYLQSGIYYVTLTYTHSEYSIYNSLFLNNCFENHDYDYDINNYSFTGSGGFNCLKGDNLKITLITDFEVTDTNATVVGNKYIWNPANENFTMRIKMDKSYQVTNEEEHLDDVSERNDSTITGNDDTPSSNEEDFEDDIETEENNQDSTLSIETLMIIGVIVLILSMILFVFLKTKKHNLDKI